jgi:two-component system response regulator AtoC
MQTCKILVVDDELLIRDLLYDHFSSKNYLISTAQSAEDAIDLLDNGEKFDVVLTDLKMPGMGGIDFIEYLREGDKMLPVIVMTGFPSLETAIEALRKRAFDYFVKPFNIKRLHAAVEAAATEYQETRKHSEGNDV